ncbi:DNA methyltransferase [uncultured Gimesia sp.]|uniref:DNA-methyltransferase n=1 Tax=uncultured Gimesia sp. TaxID=1678688 RepID=UPI00262C84BE|nr:DNA methyltransferase [uncultured Gimesia sp.]
MKKWVNQLHLGECIEGLKKTKKEQVDLVFADPPYNIGFSYDVYEDKLESSEYLRWSEDWIGACHKALKPSGAMWIAIGDEYVAEIKIIAEKLGLHLRNWVIWYYTFGVHCTQKFGRSHTHLLYFVKDPDKIVFNDSEIRVPSARQLIYNDKRANSAGRIPDNTWILRPQAAPGSFAAGHDTWYFARVAGTFKERAGFHGCQMPEQLLGRIVRCCSSVDDVVLDPFAGSGSTLCVAKKLGRQWVGYDISPEYVQLAKARINSVNNGDALEGPEDPLKSTPAISKRASRAKREKNQEQAIITAFQKASDGFSVDRVIADPVLNASFIDECSVQSLSGRPVDWNLELLALRKTGDFAQLRSSKREQVSLTKMDLYEFASEIALRRMMDMGYSSLDHILCDPYAASRFDDFARSLAPGFKSFDYRWAALRIRKQAHTWRVSSEKYVSFKKKSKRFDLDDNKFKGIPKSPAVYLLKSGSSNSLPLYIGETFNLMDRASRTISAQTALNQFAPNTGEWYLEIYLQKDVDQLDRRGLQSYLIGRNQPRMNFMELAAT